MSKQMSIQDEDLAAIRDAKYKEWLLQKELRDKGLELFSKLNRSRAEEKESILEVAIAMSAIDRILGYDEPIAKPRTEKRDADANEQKKPPKTMKISWFKWAQEHHTFSNVKFSKEDAAPLSGGVKENVNLEKDGSFTMPSLKYFFPALPKKPGEKVKPLTKDQQLQNTIYVRELKLLWREAKEEMKNRLLEAYHRAIQAKYEEDGKSKTRMSEEALGRFKAMIERNTLQALSLTRLKAWVEEDEDKILAEEKAKIREQQAESKQSHEQFVKKKDSLRIRLPPPEVIAQLRPQSAPRMNFSRSTSAMRPKVKAGAESTVDLMLLGNTGAKFVHATQRGRQGNAGDLEKGRKLLMDLGFVHKENLDGEDKYEFHNIVRNNEALNDLKARKEKEKEDGDRAFDEWVQIKSIREQALKMLSLLKPPEAPLLRTSTNGPMAVKDKEPYFGDSSKIPEVIEIGRNLKKADRSLYKDWADWARPVLSSYVSTVLWDYFDPMACDVHCSSYSQVRDSFLKLLRPGLDFKTTFKEFVERKWKKRNGGADGEEEEKKKFQEELSLSRTEFQGLLSDMGIAMKPDEIRSVIDAFDINQDGKITFSEVVSFTGPLRTKKGGAITTLSQKCCWNTTCKKTGMPNAFRISDITNAAAKMKKLVSTSTRDELQDKSVSESVTGKTEIIELSNGEKRLKVELTERSKRENLLIKYKVLELVKEKNHRNDHHEEDEYYEEDKYDDEDDNGDRAVADEEGRKKGEEEVPRCAYAKLSILERKEGLRALSNKTRGAREEEMLKAMLKDGKPPSAPSFWCANLDDEDVYDNEDENALTTQILLRWEPSKQDLVSFFSLETSGIVGRVTSEGKFKEIFRDPENADNIEFELKYTVNNLQPCTTYLFRIRGFNGFGPGDFTYGKFTTRALAPQQPKIMKLTPFSVTLQWLFSEDYNHKIEELRLIFDYADKDKSGVVSRLELAEVLDSIEEKAAAAYDDGGNNRRFGTNRGQMIASFDQQEMDHVNTLLAKLKKIAGVGPQESFGVLFDRIETDDDNELSFDEFQNFFLSHGWASSGPEKGGGAVGGMNSSRSSIASFTSTSSSRAGSGSVKGTHFIIQRCVNEWDDIYNEVTKTSSGSTTITLLQPGASYRFRVLCCNCDGLLSAPSPDIIVHTMLETPPAPICSLSMYSSGAPPVDFAAVAARQLSICWKARGDGTSTRDKSVVEKMLGKWANSHMEEGVSVEKAFRYYDRDESQTIDSSELKSLLEDLGVEATNDRLREAFNDLDANGDGVITYQEFLNWWHRDEVLCVLKRSEPIRPITLSREKVTTSNLRSTGATNIFLATIHEEASGSVDVPQTGLKPNSESKSTTSLVPVPFVCYMDQGRRCDVAGLIPNTLYHFRLRYHGSRIHSALSPPLRVMTSPLPPSPPVICRLSATWVRLKWYPSEFGAYKFVIQLLLCGGGNQEWKDVYNGPETTWVGVTLAPKTKYRVRVVALSYQGTPSIPSLELQFSTLPREEGKEVLTPRNSDVHFTIETVGDICTGDTILFSERLFSDRPNGKETFTSNTATTNKTQQQPSTSGGSRTMTATRTKSGVATVRMDMSTQSVQLTSKGVTSTGVFIGERAVAAHVLRDNYRTIRGPNSRGKDRILWLEVIWEKASTDACQPYELKTGIVIERKESVLEQFEVFRTSWLQEQGRQSLRIEKKALDECFWSVDCPQL